MTDMARRALEQEAQRLTKKYGDKTGSMGSAPIEYDTIPTGSLALDYALGTGGWPSGRVVHLYGEPDIGKSSTLGLSAFRNAQAAGKTTGLIAVEPGFDPDWAAKNGVDPSLLVVARPNNGEDAFNILYDWMTHDIVDFVIFDSIGAVVTPSEDQEEGKARVGGASGLITSGVRRILMPTYKNGKYLIFLNQVRDDMKARYAGAVKPPGGRLLTHACDIWVHLRQSAGGPEAIRKIKDEGDDVVVGRNLTAHITRNKLCEGTGNKAKFWYNNMSTVEHGPVGIDVTQDILAMAQRTKTIVRSGGWYSHPTFPGDKHQFQGIGPVREFFAENPDAVAQIRNEVIQVMKKNVKLVQPGGAPDLVAFDEAMEEAA